MRVGFYDHYLETLGGGEKYLLGILEEAVREGHEVTLLSPVRPDPVTWRRLGVAVPADGFRWRRVNQLTVTAHTAGLDRFVALHNFLPPVSLARRSVAVIQFPFRALRGGRHVLDEQVRLRSYGTWVCYSRFVETHLRARLGIARPLVIPPPVDVGDAGDGPKGRRILAVGRFFAAEDTNNKKHGLLIDAFRRLAAEGWSLDLAGGATGDAGTARHLAALREQARGLPVAFHPNAAPDELARLYREAALFWHAAGAGETAPERQEHFGITTVEAMAHGCVPLVPAAGGQLEVVDDGSTGVLWRSPDELVERTRALVADPVRTAEMGASARGAAGRFSRARFLAAVRSTVLAP